MRGGNRSAPLAGRVVSSGEPFAARLGAQTEFGKRSSLGAVGRARHDSPDAKTKVFGMQKRLTLKMKCSKRKYKAAIA